jgi:CHAT domain-containing protein/Tfp pilus assembly protein PilF
MDFRANWFHHLDIITASEMRPKNIVILLVALTMLTTVAIGQQVIKKIDSLMLDSSYDLALAEINEVLKRTSDQDQRTLLENKKAEVLIRAGNYDGAERQLESISFRTLTNYQAGLTEMNKGFLYLNQGRNDLSLASLQTSINYFEKERKQNTLEGAQALAYLGNLYLATGKYAQAEEQLTMALNIREHLVEKNSELMAASYNDLGLVYSTTDENKALDQYEKALIIYEKLHGKNHPKIAIANTNMGFVYRTLEFYGDAVSNFESALAIWEKIHVQPHPTKAFILFNLGQTYLKMQNEKAAQDYYDKALKMYQNSYGKKHPAIATVLNSMGSLKLSTRHFDEALDYYQQALISNVKDFNDADRKKNPRSKNYYSGNTLLFSLLNKAEALESRYFGKSLKFDELAQGIEILQACDSLIDDLRQQITNESDKISLGAIATEVYAAGVRMAYGAAQVSPRKNHWFELSFYFAEKSKSAVLLEAISDSDAKSFSGIPETLLEEEKKLKAEIAGIAQKLSLKPGESEERYLRETAYMLNRTYENFTRQLETKFPAYFNLKFNSATPSIKDLQAKLNDKTAILSYFTDDKNNRIYIFQLTSRKFKTTSRTLPKEFDKYLTGLRNSLFFNEMETYNTTADKLSELLVPAIPQGIDELVILPTGRLSIIPFEVLFSGKVGKENTFTTLPYLIRDYSIRYEFSAALILQKSKTSATATASIFLCAPVTFEKAELQSLPASESEVKEIAALFSSKNFKSEVFVGNYADEKLVKTGGLKDYTYLHFATHGIVDEIHPELSKIFLHSAGGEDGNLFSGEIYNLELNANLVTLSACQTGLGKISKGEGVIGLSRALVYAGSKNIMVSFWSVADQSTATLMKDFYRQMLSHPGAPLAEDLRAAKLTLIKDNKYAAPYYWAPFVLIGF